MPRSLLHTVHTSHTAVRIDAQDVSKGVNGTKILSKISLSIHPGEFVGLLGPSGAGKSTLLNALNGFRPADEGRVLLNGTHLYKHFNRFRTLIGYVPQDDIVHTSLSVKKAFYYSALLRLPFSATARRSEREKLIHTRITEVLHMLDLEAQANTRIKRLSGGQRKRVSLGIELLTSPPLLFLDEPTSGLDPGLEERMMRLFHRFTREGRTVIITTHIMESLELLDLVAILVKGHLVFYGPPRLALKAFRVPEFSEIYKRLDRYNPADLARQYRLSPLYKKYITARLSKRYKTEPIPPADPTSSAPPKTPSPPQAAPRSEQPPSASPTPDTDRSLDDELAALKKRLNEQDR
ncbi:ATP-binding cassette domain-containing protein [candidate division KSB3 bacterium]|uniref:ATP-binding cassette domain-containing protein n=1 Tax=candidate division KSB3 bacterium TaxID=2044937 RepID=A0A9D5Q5F2_9BACT|nr:ATP-binding cassette domain-containing protein [candidate division KSB3 bacterium]